MKITAQDLPETMQKIRATFDSYWNSSEFEDYDAEQGDRLAQALRSERQSGRSSTLPLFDVSPYPYQQEILDKLEAERSIRNRYKILSLQQLGLERQSSQHLITAVLQRQPGKPNRLLFVAHRRNFEAEPCMLQGHNEEPKLWRLVRWRYRPDSLDHLFISIQTFQSQALVRRPLQTSTIYYSR